MSYPKQRPEPAKWPQEAVPAWAHSRSRAYLESRHVSKNECYDYELAYCADGFWKDRLLIPQFDAKGELQMFQGRSLNGGEPRYRTAGCRHVYDPALLASRADRDHRDRVLVVEGPFDLISVARITPHVVATLGTMVSPLQIQEIISLAFPHVSILFDRGAEREAFALQLKLQPYASTEVLLLRDAKDPGELDPDAIRAILQ